MNYLNSYFRSKLDLSSVGFLRGEKESGCFCTPIHARVIGRAGVDGIHFCTTRDFGELVFAVSPSNCPGEYVHPVAKNFEDFLRLLLACHDTAAIEQCWFMDREVFESFLKENPPTDEMRKCLEAIREKYRLTPMEDPFGYIHALQAGFDYASLQFQPEYYELVEEAPEPRAPEWKVTWEGDFFEENPEAIGADPVKVDAWFRWADMDWYVPEAYSFERGVIVYLLGRVDPALVPRESFEGDSSPEVRERMLAENPLNLQARHEITINGLAMRPAGSMGITWVPEPDWNLESKWVLEHYGLDTNSAWQISRVRAFWPECGRMNIENMNLTMRQHAVPVSGTHFKTPLAEAAVQLSHPWTGKEYALYVDELKQETVDVGGFHDQSMEYPACYTRMVFRIEPDMQRNQFRIVDCARSDQPRYKEGRKTPDHASAVSVGIIGGADGPIAIIPARSQEAVPQTHLAISSLRFEPAGEIEWRIVFQEKPHEDMTVSLL